MVQFTDKHIYIEHRFTFILKEISHGTVYFYIILISLKLVDKHLIK